MTDKAASPVSSDDSAPSDLLYEAWCVIANAVGWDDDTEWRRAATRWRDRWHSQRLDEQHLVQQISQQLNQLDDTAQKLWNAAEAIQRRSST